MSKKRNNPETIAIHGGDYRSDPTTNAVAVPIYQTTSYQFKDPKTAANLFGLKEWFSEIFSYYRKTDNNFILYNIPQVTGVRVENRLISELRQEFGPHLVYGVKDSSGSLESAKSYLEDRNLMVAIGDERLIADSVSLGASGSICGLSNILPKEIIKILNKTINVEI